MRHGVLKPHGHTTTASPDGGVVEHDTLQCCHCGRHWQIRPGSGRKRGWCMKCSGPTCGAQKCVECLPYKKRIELYEQGKLKTLT